MVPRSTLVSLRPLAVQRRQTVAACACLCRVPFPGPALPAASLSTAGRRAWRLRLPVGVCSWTPSLPTPQPPPPPQASAAASPLPAPAPVPCCLLGRQSLFLLAERPATACSSPVQGASGRRFPPSLPLSFPPSGGRSLLPSPAQVPFHPVPALESANMRVLACLIAALMGIQAVERLRLADGPHGCAGRLEVWHGGRWGTVCDDGWDLRDAAVACRELGCGGALAAPGGAFFGEGSGPVWLSELACRGSEGQLGLCPHRGWKAHICSHEEDAGVVCAGQRVANSRDGEDPPSILEGDLWPGLSGELSPGSQEPPVTHAPRQAGAPQNNSRKKSLKPVKQPKSTRAPMLTAGAPRQERLRLVSGPHGCSGRLEVWHGGRWGTVCDDGWDLRDAAVACRELGCGSALAAPGGARFGPGSGPVWMDDVGCGGGEQALRDCPRSPWGRSNCDHSEDAGLVCTGPAPRLRLADGPHGCAGRLEVWHSGRWGTVCDDAWDLRDATVACRELGCGGALAAPGGAFFGEGAGPILLDDLRCRGNETALRFCPTRPWGQHDCHHREDAGAVCDGMPLGYVPTTAPAADSNRSSSQEAVSRPPAPTRSLSLGTADIPPPPASPTVPWETGPEAGSPQLRLVAGPSRCSGRLEVWHNGLWGTVCDDSWDLQDSAVVCRELGCGRARQQDPAAGRFGWGAGPIWLDDVGCLGTEASLSECPASPWGKHNCAHNEDVGISCTDTLGLDSISDPFSWSWIPGLGRDPDAWLPGELTTKPPAKLTPSVPEKTTTKAPGRNPKGTKKWVTKNARRLTTQPPVIPTTKHSRVLGTQRPPELTSQTTTTLTTEASRRTVSESTARLSTEAPHRMTSHTTATRTPRAPRERTAKTVATPTTQSPREMTSEATVEQIPLASTEPSAETPTQGSPDSSKDPAPSPTGSTAGGSAGPFRVRLADGPNRCAGRLEVWHAGRWGTVCDDSWDLRDSTVACWELGCGRVRSRVGKTHYGPGTGPIWLDDVGCKGIEASLSDCPAGAWGQHNCDHEEDVGLTCTGHADEDDYPPWTWDPTFGEDLAKLTTTAGVPGHMLSWGTTKSPGAPSPATRRLPDTGNEDSYKPSWTWDTPSGGAPPEGTPTAGRPGSTLTTATTQRPGRPSSAPRIRGDTGSLRKLWPDRRPQRPTAARTAPPAASPAPSASPEPPGPPVTPDSAPRLIPEAASRRGVTSDPPDTSTPNPDLASQMNSDLTLTTPGLTLSTPEGAVTPALIPDLSPTPPPTLPKELTSDPSAPSVVTHLSSTSELTPESDTTPNLGTAPYANTFPDHSKSPDSSINPHPTGTPHSTLTSQPMTTPHSATTPPLTRTPQPTTPPQPTISLQPTTSIQPTTTPHPTMTPQSTASPLTTTPHPITNPHPATTPHPTMTLHSTTSTHPSMTANPTSTPMITTKSILTSSGTELFSPTPAPTVKSSLHPWLTSTGSSHLSTSKMSSLAPFPNSESSHSRPSPAPSVDTLSTDDFEPPRSQSPKPSPPPPQTPHSASDPTVTSDLHLSSMALPLGQPFPDHLTPRPTPGQSPDPLGPCVAPTPPVRVMACEPPALVELVAAVREVGGQLQRLTQVLEKEQQQRQALGLGLTQLVEATRNLGQLGEVVKRLAEGAWPPSTSAPATTTPEEEERPLRGDV
ncbi:soluble scavenger receptor cysteine-rich domain-containing protein SSC5D isoform X3 [Mustela erminea]|uniref:soluble scavenger receptor cysteine-rich domain-containing protein SSC5D isoform X3 n=1 Tax=Mustela erminea TaxID=36723 RepID=UPI001386DA1E|nr:soluble scavenger receptor cysteine-rich domain-containing protein SSC5D isoform X3 [Mustela erminea]